MCVDMLMLASKYASIFLTQIVGVTIAIGLLELAAINKIQATSSRIPQKFRLAWVEFEAVRRHPFCYVADVPNDSGF